ncbi:MAG: ATP-binding protein [Desulfosalsimonas sp.]
MKTKNISSYISPWIIIGTAVLLLAVLAAMAVNNYNREKRYMAQILVEKGSALIKSFEACTRTGMMAMGWGERQVQYLMEELADQADVLYITVTDTRGRILAHSDSEKIGQQFENEFDPENPADYQEAKWRLTDTDGGMPAFEVYGFFNPYTSRRGHMGRMGRRGHMGQGGHMGRMEEEGGEGWCAPGNYDPDNYEKNRQLIFIGFDRTPFIEARHQDFKNTAVISSVVLVLGFAGFTSMLVAQRYRAARRRLQDTSAIADEVVSGLPDGLIVTDSQGVIILANPSAESISGLSEKDIRGRPAREVLPENLAEQLETAEHEARVREKDIECSFAGKDQVPLSISSARIVNEEDVFIGSLVIFRDLTEIRALHQQMQRKEKLAAVGGLAAGIAHEIRNPLSSVKGMATYFKNRFTDDQDAKQAAQVMIQETERLNRVINELLEFARPSQINARAEDINRVLDHSIRLIRQEAEDHGIELKLRKGGDLPLAEIDPDRFVQCLLNLYLNSIQAMEQGGEITAETGISEQGSIFVSIADTGGGIAGEELSRIFDPYFTTKPAGTGLGLAIVHKIVEDHGGQLTVNSTPGKGTVFAIYLQPARQKETKKETP